MRYLLMMLALGLAGCSTSGDYYAAVESANKYQYEIAKARAQAEAIRFEAMRQIAADGDATAKVAAAMGLAFVNAQTQAQQSGAMMPAQPQSAALQWAQVLAGPLTQLGGAYFGMQTQLRASDNARDVSLSTNATMLGFGQAVQTGSTHGYQFVNPTPVIAPDPVIVPPAEPVIVQPVIVQPEVVQIPTQVIAP